MAKKRVVKKQLQSKRSFSTVLLIAILSVLATIVAVLLINQHKHYGYVLEVPIDIKISENKAIGFNVATDALHFGTQPPGSYSEQELNVTNEYNLAYAVHLEASGGLKQWVVIAENDFIISPLSSKKVKISIKSPLTAKPGSYSGNIIGYFS